MSEIKPVYQRYCNDEKWLDINKARYDKEVEADCAATRILYPAAAYEALKEENEALHKNHDLLQAKVDCLYDQIELEKSKTRGEEETVKRVVTYSEALQKENAELMKDRQQYANRADLSEKSVRVLQAMNAAQAKRIAHQQYLIDRLMMEYCPDEMTEEQWENWKAHQRRVTL